MARLSIFQRLFTLLSASLYGLGPISILLLSYVYFYPIAHSCHFPSPPCQHSSAPSFPGSIWPTPENVAPFRMLALGDPQIEGDSAIKGAEGMARYRGYSRPVQLLVRLLKTLDLWGNDYYLAHIYRTLRRQLHPTHVTVLGDLLGSQWIDDDEFDRRADRFWSKAFKGGQAVDHAVITGDRSESNWNDKIINVVGNHDIGYAGDIDKHRIERFEHRFGKSNYVVEFIVPESYTKKRFPNSTTMIAPKLRIVNLNSLLLDSPAGSLDMQAEVHQFLESLAVPETQSTATVLLTHLPLHKATGICTDGPLIEFFEDSSHHQGIRTQNHISQAMSRKILERLFGITRSASMPQEEYQAKYPRNFLASPSGVILTGHDHTGCDVLHTYQLQTHLPRHPSQQEFPEAAWSAVRIERGGTVSLNDSEPLQAVREVTARSMMGAYGGWSVMLSAWPEANDLATDEVTWRFEVAYCNLGVQHIWWAIHILAIVTVGIATVVIVGKSITRKGRDRKRGRKKRKVPGKKSDEKVPVSAAPVSLTAIKHEYVLLSSPNGDGVKGKKRRKR